jgi:threonine dehydrogenase-like Zn-dependent dehydrogenase
VIYNVRRSNRESETALRLLSEQAGRFGFLFTHALPLERVQSAFEMLRDHSDGAGKVVIHFQ